MGSGRCRVWAVAVAVAVGGSGAAAASAPASGQQMGTVVVRLVTDPSPPGVTWTFSGLGSAFELGASAGERTLSLPAGSYGLQETPTEPGANSLTALACSDPDGNTVTDLAAASATIGLDDGETVNCTFTHRALGRRSAAASLALARRFSPVLRLSGGEPYRPLRLEDYLGVSSLHVGTPPHGALLQPHPTLFSLPTTPGRAYLDVVGAAPNADATVYPQIEARLQARRPRPTIYWHIARRPATGRIAVEYWLLYLYNDFYDRHEADWENVTVILQGQQPLGVSYSSHQGRRWSTWTNQTTSGTHPIVYVARGSHANYPGPGRFRVRICFTLRGRHCTTTPRLDTATGTGPTLNPDTYTLQELGGAPYSGDWSSGTYILGIGETNDHITDPRTRSDYSDPFTILGRTA